MIPPTKFLYVALVAVFTGLWVLGWSLSWWVFIPLILALAVSVSLLDHFYFSKKRKHIYAQREKSRREKIEASVGEIVLNKAGIPSISLQNKTDIHFDFRLTLYLRYTHENGTPKAGGPAQAVALLSTHRKVQLRPGKSLNFDLLNTKEDRVALAKEESLYHQGLMPFLVESDPLMTLLREQPDIYALECRIWKFKPEVLRVFHFNTQT